MWMRGAMSHEPRPKRGMSTLISQKNWPIQRGRWTQRLSIWKFHDHGDHEVRPKGLKWGNQGIVMGLAFAWNHCLLALYNWLWMQTREASLLFQRCQRNIIISNGLWLLPLLPWFFPSLFSNGGGGGRSHWF